MRRALRGSLASSVLATVRLLPSPEVKRLESAKATTGKASKGFTDEERAAMRERAQELKAAARRGPRAGKADGDSDVLAKIAEMQGPDRAMAKRRSTRSSKPARQRSRREPGTGCPRTPRTARSSASSKARRVQIQVSDVRPQRRGEARRRRHVADRLRAEGVDRRRREEDRRAREEGGELRSEPSDPRLGAGRGRSGVGRPEAAAARDRATRSPSFRFATWASRPRFGSGSARSRRRPASPFTATAGETALTSWSGFSAPP